MMDDICEAIDWQGKEVRCDVCPHRDLLIPNPVDSFGIRPPHPNPLPKGRGRQAAALRSRGEDISGVPLSPSAPACGCGSKRCKHAKACSRGEGQDEGGLCEAIDRNCYRRRALRLHACLRERPLRAPHRPVLRLEPVARQRLPRAPAFRGPRHRRQVCGCFPAAAAARRSRRGGALERCAALAAPLSLAAAQRSPSRGTHPRRLAPRRRGFEPHDARSGLLRADPGGAAHLA